ncbi:MAG TPA: hypothetical protein VH643_39330 [Gemmataceae bacterium]|jgi:hypothetical protein
MSEPSAGSAHSLPENKVAIEDLRRRYNRLRIWLFIFLALMPLGCAGPLTLLALIPGLPKTAFVITSFALPVVGLAGTLLMGGDRSIVKRALAGAQQAERMGLHFSQYTGGVAEAKRWQSLQMFGGADEHDSGGNLLWGEIDGERISFEDYVFVLGMGQNRSSHSRTLITLPEAARGLPDFLLTPNDWREKLSKLLGDRTIDFSNEPAFARQFTVRGPAPDAVRACFSPEVIELCMADKHLIAEVQNGVLAIRPHGKLSHPKSYPELANHAVRLAKALRNAAQRQALEGSAPTR